MTGKQGQKWKIAAVYLSAGGKKLGFLLLGLLGQNWIVTFLATFSTTEMV
jgi:hypothetical protein